MKRSKAPQQPRPRRLSLLCFVVLFFLHLVFFLFVVSLIAFVYLFVVFLTVFKHLTKERKKENSTGRRRKEKAKALVGGHVNG